MKIPALWPFKRRRGQATNSTATSPLPASAQSERVAADPKAERPLPPYLGWGTLASETVRWEESTLLAQYRWNGEPVYDIRWDGDRCRLSRVGYPADSFDSTLENAFLRYMMFVDLADDPQFERFVATTQRGNVLFTFPERPLQKGGQSRWVVYPGGFIYVLRLPVIEENVSAWTAFRRNLGHGELGAMLHFYTEAPGLILKLLEDRSVSLERVSIVEFSAILKDLPACVQVLVEHGVIASGKTHRLNLLPALQMADAILSVHPGDPSAGYLAFSVWRDTPPISDDEIVRRFQEGAEQSVREWGLG